MSLKNVENEAWRQNETQKKRDEPFECNVIRYKADLVSFTGFVGKTPSRETSACDQRGKDIRTDDELSTRIRQTSDKLISSVREKDTFTGHQRIQIGHILDQLSEMIICEKQPQLKKNFQIEPENLEEKTAGTLRFGIVQRELPEEFLEKQHLASMLFGIKLGRSWNQIR